MTWSPSSKPRGPKNFAFICRTCGWKGRRAAQPTYCPQCKNRTISRDRTK